MDVILGVAVSVVGVCGTLASIFAAWAGYKKGLKKEGAQDGTLKSDIQYIKRRTDDVLLEQREINKTVGALTERVAKVEESTKSAHKRIDTVENKIEGSY